MRVLIMLSTLLVAACSDPARTAAGPEPSTASNAHTAAPARTEAAGASESGRVRAAAIRANSKAAAAPLPEGIRRVDCDIQTGGSRFQGPCLLDAGPSGSFTLGSTDRDTGVLFPSSDKDFPSIISVSVWVVTPGEAEVRGLTTFGVNSRWGPATRSKDDPACWVGDDFRVCAREPGLQPGR